MIYERIRQLRETLGLNQTDFSAAIGFSQSTITMIESGRREVQERHIKTICSAFNVNEEWLRTGEGEMFNPKSVDDSIIDAFGKLMAEDDNSIAKQFNAALAQLTPK